ncbi:enoyl-CoA hydratase [Bacillus sp. FJAT-18017]|uniref:enoyl-CoA hydratase-related protein n=1 Tax=Bacillus sp. FJAT-18017 TaxID=1705566 RepID=UPI0006AD9F37|nr:enoyl-CoA hydratase-related protein [Bacillus sp. FJAT-18017]ALC91931.1 enoyl-CoA hydratase [Bacillus sp. FJAT-18017]
MDLILLEKKNYIAIITINRPQAMNAFNYETLLRLQEVVEEVSADQTIRVVIFTGAGEKAFSVGADLKERKTLSVEQVLRNVGKISEVFNLVDGMPQPTIAAINGYAFGGGMELALACDFRIAEQGIQLGLTETSLAIIPGAGGTQRLPRLIGQAKALELILGAHRLTAGEADQYGLLTRLAEEGKVMESSLEFAERLLGNGPIALRQAKFAIKRGMETDLQTGLKIEREAYEELIPTEDRVEALVAFSEKRKPNFKGK